jgi:tetratricopeptide (TPR) repeat protein
MITLRQIVKSIGLIVFIINCLSGFSQQENTKSLSEKVTDNARLYNNNLDSAYAELDGLIGQAVLAQDTMSELTLLERKCRYFYQKNQLENMIEASENLEEKADRYHDLYAQSMANVYLSEAYSINQLFDKALIHLGKAYEILSKDNSKNKEIVLAKSNVLNSFANVYLDMGEPEKAVAKLMQGIKKYEDLEDISDIIRFQYLNYSNIATAYSLYNLDSAEFFASKSIEIKPSNIDDDKIMVTNYLVLGRVYKERKEIQTAISYYQKALQISQKTGDQLNLRSIYTDLVDLYNQTGNNDSVIHFDNKLKELEIQNLQTKYSSLQMIIDKDQQPEKKNLTNVWLIFTLLMIVLGSIFLIIYLIKKKQKRPPLPPQDIYNSLIELVKKNDPGFLFAFEQAHPEFSLRLLEINPQLSKPEIEFCALLKLNLSTKEIARLKFIETRTVQNKKYRIRKRLNIPGSNDIYNWFGAI